MSLIVPMFMMVLLTFVVLLMTAATRFKAVKQGLDPRYFRTYSVGCPSDEVLKTGNHFSNLFEVPVLFYAACLAAMQLGMHSYGLVALAWLFVVLRFWHTYIHLGSNKVLVRMRVFFAGMLVVLCMWIMILISALNLGLSH